jgi:hypothetical protein
MQWWKKNCKQLCHTFPVLNISVQIFQDIWTNNLNIPISFVRSQLIVLFKHMQQHTTKQNMNIFFPLINDDEYNLLGNQILCSQQQLEKYFDFTFWFCWEKCMESIQFEIWG